MRWRAGRMSEVCSVVRLLGAEQGAWLDVLVLGAG